MSDTLVIHRSEIYLCPLCGSVVRNHPLNEHSVVCSDSKCSAHEVPMSPLNIIGAYSILAVNGPCCRWPLKGG